MGAFLTRQAIQCFLVSGNGVVDHLVRQKWSRILLVPLTFRHKRFGVVANILLVEAVLFAPGLPVIGRPEAGAVRGQYLVNQHDFTRCIQSKLEFCISNDDAA